MLPQSALADVVNAVSDAVVGMGPIEFLLKDPEVTEVMIARWTPLDLRVPGSFEMRASRARPSTCPA
jgi:Flp pilus assembly CpaF family ATPase